MKLKYSFFPFFIALPLTLSSCCDKQSCQAGKGSDLTSQKATPVTASSDALTIRQSLVRINSTIQVWSASQPWDKSAPKKRRALGALLSGNRVLTTAEMAADATYIELENADNTRIIPAKVTAIDYEANLALLEPDNGDIDSFFEDLVATVAWFTCKNR